MRGVPNLYDDGAPLGVPSMLAACATLSELRLAARSLSETTLATPLSPVFDTLALYPDQREIIDQLCNELGVSTLGELLESADLNRRLVARLSRQKLRRFVQGLGSWLADEVIGARLRKPAPLPAALPVPGALFPGRPDSRRALERWADERAVLDCANTCLDDLPDAVFSAQTRVFRSGDRTVAWCFEPRFAPDPNGELLRQQLWGWLEAEASAVSDARARGPFRPPAPADPALNDVFQRLSTARAPLDVPFPARPRPIKARIEARGDPLSVHLQLSTRESLNGQPWTQRPRVEVTLPRSGPPEAFCTCRHASCPHAAVAFDLLMAEVSGGSELATTLAGELAAPLWRKALAVTSARSNFKPQVPQELRFVVSLHRKQVRLDIIAHKLGKRGPLDNGRHVPPRRALGYPNLSPADRRTLEQLALYEPEIDYTEGDVHFLAEAVLSLEGHPRVVLADERADRAPRAVAVRTARAALELEETPQGLRPRFSVGGVPIDFEACVLVPRNHDRLLLVPARDVLWLAVIDDATLAFMGGVSKYQAAFPAEAHEALLERLGTLKGLDAVLPEALAGAEVTPSPKCVVRVEPSGSEGLFLVVRVRPAEGAEPALPGAGQTRATFRRDGKRFFSTRALEAERPLADALVAQLELPPRADYSWEVLDAHRTIALIDRLEGLARAGLDVEWPASRWRLSRAAQTKDVKVKISRKRDWFGLDGEVEVDGERVELAVLLDSVRRRRRWIRLKERQWLRLSQDLIDKLQSLSHVASEGEDGLEVTWAALPALESLEGQLEQLSVATEFSQMLTRVREAGRLEPQLPEGLNATLRDYQLQGFQWLSRLAAWGAGACLADDMGLGKTVQALALLLSRSKLGPALVVAPTSVLFNWREEAARFAPALKVHEYHTADRAELLGKLGPDDVVLTSWALLARDAEGFAAREFSTLVLDEAQAIKNAATQRAKAARALKASFKVALSGTPLENHLGELWSLYRVVLPGLFGSQEQFRARFAGPIERDKNEAARQALAAVVRPFLLRRNKSEVAKELPPRTEVALHVELSEAERKLYDDARLAAVADLKSSGGGPHEHKRFQALAALTRLRQIACHPRLYDEHWTGPASKLSRLMELLTDLREAGHRALVFSQFTSHLALVRDAVTAAGFRFQYLDGSTPLAQRQERVEAFQRGEGELFLISLKAGGMGLNLTAADYVVHLDPWWNPAVEDQATDRAHRIGQDKPVTVYRLIAQGTVEEGIVSLHAEKRDLVAGVLDGSGTAGALSTEDLVALIRGGA
jgi:SNF2 family DNA or RNA helicase